MALNGNILLPSFFCPSSGVSGQQAGRPEGGASHPRCIHVGPRVRGAAGTPRKRLEGAFGARFRLRSLAGAGTREVKRLSASSALPPVSQVILNNKTIGGGGLFAPKPKVLEVVCSVECSRSRLQIQSPCRRNIDQRTLFQYPNAYLSSSRVYPVRARGSFQF